MSDAEEQAKRKRNPDDNDGEAMKKAIKWAEEFNDLDEEEQYVYLEELAPRMSRMHMQFLLGIIGTEGDEFDDEGSFDDEDDLDDDDDDEAGEDEAEEAEEDI